MSLFFCSSVFRKGGDISIFSGYVMIERGNTDIFCDHVIESGNYIFLCDRTLWKRRDAEVLVAT
jgi:hypothetical protein